MPQIRVRPYAVESARALEAAGHPPLLARLYAARGVDSPAALRHKLAELDDYRLLKSIQPAAARLADAIARRERLLIVADYDADGATACAVGVRGLRALGAEVDYLVPNRFEYGYGLTPEIVALAAERQPNLLLTVDNGIAALAGVAAARASGIEVLVTDHHLPGDALPDCLIVNPNQPGCAFPSKHLAGVGVMFYLLMALRAELRERGAFAEREAPNLAELLDLVALGTVADVVKLDANNRLLVGQGLARMRRGLVSPGLRALFTAAGRRPEMASVSDLGFFIGPRLNAAGRLSDMSLGIACLLEDDPDAALVMAGELDRLNRERKVIETEMQSQAEALLANIEVASGYSLVLHDPAWHPGVVGLLASRLKERHHRPALIFADGGQGALKGSGRAIPGLHLRDALDLVDKRHPGLIVRFGGHAAAAGLTLRAEDFPRFAEGFEAVARELMCETDLEHCIETDGELAADEFSLDTAERLKQLVWGQGFAPPSFQGVFEVTARRIVGEKHLKLTLQAPGWQAEAMLFNHADPVPAQIEAVYRLDLNEWNGRRSAQLIVEHWREPA